MSKFVVGLTGGIGSGKTTIANLFAQYGIDIIDADVIARKVVEPQSDALKQISHYFGDDILDNNGALNRAKLREFVFQNTAAKTWLNNLLHPIIRSEMINAIKQAQSDYCLLVVPLLVENELTYLVNRVLVVDVPTEVQISRTCARDESSKEIVQGIITSQATREQRISVADDIIDNNVTNSDTIKNEVAKLHQLYIRLANQ